MLDKQCGYPVKADFCKANCHPTKKFKAKQVQKTCLDSVQRLWIEVLI
ncbi:hypothetical protein ANACOL_02763 [Anaerotruncus colihominis DSM 17241]|uniref:Uncharacterized protein n=1 Tax=Anaerotruncus colihominis DSM 17241 TaxID=445972 RepID=B0PDX8_9FIRM|nr:hypothetical protein ANACOL_02763 [Anaerotruncus colihominis DSM 17241]